MCCMSVLRVIWLVVACVDRLPAVLLRLIYDVCVYDCHMRFMADVLRLFMIVLCVLLLVPDVFYA